MEYPYFLLCITTTLLFQGQNAPLETSPYSTNSLEWNIVLNAQDLLSKALGKYGIYIFGKKKRRRKGRKDSGVVHIRIMTRALRMGLCVWDTHNWEISMNAERHSCRSGCMIPKVINRMSKTDKMKTISRSTTTGRRTDWATQRAGAKLWVSYHSRS